MDFVLHKIDKRWDNHRSLDQHMKELGRKLVDLNALKEDIESIIREELHPRKKLKKQVHIWLGNVERINGEMQNLEQSVGESSVVFRGFHAENVLRKIEEVKELLQQGKFLEGMVVDETRRIGQTLSTTTLFGAVAEICKNEIWAHLLDENIRKIGVLGMGGVGKTAIMKLINNQLLKETDKFDIVIWITVSKEVNISKLQNSIAHAMGVELRKDEDETVTAGILYEMLARKGRYVLILDDLWDKLSLEEVGVPEPSNGSKLVVTTRSLDVCRYLDCKEIRMPTLPKQDGLTLFLEKVGRDVLNYPDLLPIVESVAEECAGLPLAIVTIASCMKSIRDIHEWRNALYELNRCVKSVNGLDEKAFQRLKFSYDRLEDETVKHCFLYCALYPEDHEIDTNELISFWIAEGLVEEMDIWQAKVDRGHTILNKLINNCLLEDGIPFNPEVKLHDVLRDMALHITSVRPRFLVRAGMQLKEIPDVQQWTEDLEKVSLMRNESLVIPSEMPPPKCHMLTTLLLSQCSIENIPECFFEQMQGLKILDLSQNDIESLSNSISNLTNLTILLLLKCNKLKKLPSFSKLQALWKLDLGETSIEDLPHGMERLVNLKFLNLSDTDITKVPGGILSKLSCLENLVVDKLFERGKRFVIGEEIGALRKLEIFRGRFYDLNDLNSYVQDLYGQSLGPCEYNICVGNQNLNGDSSWKKCVKLNACRIHTDGVKFPFDLQQLIIVDCVVDFWEEEVFFSWCIPVPHCSFSSLKEIYLSYCRKMKKLFSCNWVLQNLQLLEVLRVWDCEEMEEIIDSEFELATIKFALPKLRALRLGNLPELKSICSANGVMVCESLECINIQNCSRLDRIPLFLPLLDDGRPSPPPSLKEMCIYSKEWWKSVKWDHPNAKSLLEPFVKYWDNNERRYLPLARTISVYPWRY